MTTPAQTAPAAPSALFDFLDQSHRDIVGKLNQMHALVQVLESEGISRPMRHQAAALVAWFSTEARQHHLDEEKHVFPPLLSSKNEELVQNTHRLIQDHSWLEADWLQIEPSLSAVADGNLWFDAAELRQAVEVFRQLYLDHIQLEEALAFPQARSRGAVAPLSEAGTEMARRRALRDVHSGASSA